MDKRLKQQLDFVLEIDKEKNIFRQTHLSEIPVPTVHAAHLNSRKLINFKTIHSSLL